MLFKGFNHQKMHISAELETKEVTPTMAKTAEVQIQKIICRSLKNRFEGQEDCLFKDFIDSQHHTVIHQSFVQFAQKCRNLSTFVSNHENLETLPKEVKDNFLTTKELRERIQRNLLFDQAQKMQFVTDLQKQEFLRKLISDLQNDFNENYMQELIYVIWHIWEKYLEYKQKLKTPYKIANFYQVHKIFSLETIDTEAEEMTVKQNCFYMEQDQSQIIAASKIASVEISHRLFYCKKLTLLNLNSEKSQVEQPEGFIFSEFSNFISKVCSSVYLTIENYFLNPDFKDQVEMNSTFKRKSEPFTFDSDEDENVEQKFGHKKIKQNYSHF